MNSMITYQKNGTILCGKYEITETQANNYRAWVASRDGKAEKYVNIAGSDKGKPSDTDRNFALHFLSIWCMGHSNG